jgi:hypothetical protein
MGILGAGNLVGEVFIPFDYSPFCLLSFFFFLFFPILTGTETKIVRRMENIVDDDEERFVLFSAHDGTLLALFAALELWELGSCPTAPSLLLNVSLISVHSFSFSPRSSSLCCTHCV